jgi:hypothetical protein
MAACFTAILRKRELSRFLRASTSVIPAADMSLPLGFIDLVLVLVMFLVCRSMPQYPAM